MTAHDHLEKLSGRDRQLVDLLMQVLVDPNLHTDTRMRLHYEIGKLLDEAREQRPPLSKAVDQPGPPEGAPLG